MNITPEISYVTGFIIGDGNLSKSSYLIRAVEENEEFIRIFAEIFEKAFGKRPKIYFDKFNNSFVAYIHCKSIWEFLVKELKIPPGAKSRIVRVPSQIINSTLQLKCSFLSGIFDAEGSPNKQLDSHHPNGYPRIELKVCNKPLLEDLSKLLKEIGIKHRIYHYPAFSLLGIYGRNECSKFLNYVGFKHPIKCKKLNVLL